MVTSSGLVDVDGAEPKREGLCHLPQPPLDLAASSAVPKMLEHGGMVWDRKRSPNDISPLVALTGAVWHLLQPVEEQRRSAYEDRGVLTV